MARWRISAFPPGAAGPSPGGQDDKWQLMAGNPDAYEGHSPQIGSTFFETALTGYQPLRAVDHGAKGTRTIK